MSNTKIVVIKRKQLLYAGVIIFLVVIALLLLIFYPRSSSDDSTNSTPQYNNEAARYTAGVYTSVITLNDNLLNLEVIVDKNHINSIRISNLDNEITTMYPLVAPALEQIAEQLYLDVAFDSIKFSDDSKYTQTLLLNSIKETLNKAEIDDSTD